MTLYIVTDTATPTTPTRTYLTSDEYSVEGTPTIIASAISTGVDGMTRYEVKEIESRLVIHQSTETFTLVSIPTTRTCR